MAAKKYTFLFTLADGTTHSIPIEIPTGEDGGYYLPKITQVSDSEIEITFVPSVAGMPSVDSVRLKLQDSGGNVDLTGYATEQYVKDYAQPKGEYLKSSELPNAVNTALAEAKASGEFDGADGKDGVDGQPGKDGYTPQKGIDYFDGQPGKDGVDGKDGYTPVKGVDYFDGNPGRDGVDGKDGSDGYTPVKGKDYFDGKDGQDGSPGKDGSDGVSATHSWNGTVLTVTSASGTSSADLKGEPGKDGSDGKDGSAGADGVSPTVAVSKSGKVTTVSITDKNGTKTATINDGADGSPGSAGKDGTSVAITKVTESTADGGSNVVTFSDGKTLTVKNGKTGAAGKDGSDGLPGADGAPGQDGYTPVRGIDYYTEADKAEFSTYIATELAKRGQLKPEFANSIEECTDTTKLYVLPDGMIYAYMAYENIVEGGEPLFTNLADPTSSDWNTDKRLSFSSGSMSDCTGAIVSNVIPMKRGDTIRVKGLRDGSTTATIFVGFNAYSDETGVTKTWSNPMGFTKTAKDGLGGIEKLTTIEDGAYVYKGFLHYTNSTAETNNTPTERSGTVVCVRVCGEPVTTVDDIIVTVNEEIKYSEASSETGYKWQSTGHAFVPADYEDRIIEVEKKTTQHTIKIAALEKAVASGSTDDTEAAALERIKVWDKPVYDSAPVTLLNDDRAKPALTSADMTVAAIHAKYRALMARYPRYIKETYLGPCTSSDTFPAVDMLRFDFCEPDGLTEPTLGPEATHETKPKIIFISGIHKEYAGVYGLYYALEEITTNPAFYDIRRNAHIIVVPCANPFGLTSQTAIDGWQMSHVNANGIAPHNNFGVNHRSLGTVGEYNYGGTTPYSELETQYIDAVMAENSDAIAFVTCHNNNYSTYYGSHVIWASSATYHMCNLTFRLVDKMTTAWLEKYGQTLKDAIDQYKFNMDADDYRLGRATMSTSRGTEQQNATKYGILATNLEIPDRMRVFSGETINTSEVMTRGAEVYANFIRIILSAYDANDRKTYAPNLPWK